MKVIDIEVNDSNEDTYLQSVAAQGYDFAIVYRNGHKFIDRHAFEQGFIQQDFFIMGHVLDRTAHDAYYELHHQCYVINLNLYKSLRCPAIGQQEYLSKHLQVIPYRSEENFHDDYTPKWVKPGLYIKEFEHKAHGWNIISTALSHYLPVVVFDHYMRATKEFDYETDR